MSSFISDDELIKALSQYHYCRPIAGVGWCGIDIMAYTRGSALNDRLDEAASAELTGRTNDDN